MPNPPPPPGNPPRPEEKDETAADEVGVTLPPPTAELKPIKDGFPLPGAVELCDAATAARDNCARDEPLRFRFCKEPIPTRNFINSQFYQ